MVRDLSSLNTTKRTESHRAEMGCSHLPATMTTVKKTLIRRSIGIYHSMIDNPPWCRKNRNGCRQPSSSCAFLPYYVRACCSTLHGARLDPTHLSVPASSSILGTGRLRNVSLSPLYQPSQWGLLAARLVRQVSTQPAAPSPVAHCQAHTTQHSTTAGKAGAAGH